MENKNYLHLHKAVGFHGEDLAVKYLTEKSYKIIERNHRNKMGEIDIIALKDGYIVFIEVKTRYNNKYGTPREAITPAKMRKIIKAATYYLQQKGKFYESCRFDVVEVIIDNEINKCTINVIEDAFAT